ncbi:hypothetical protein BsWGS_01391 [Bradybaena similaris]
MPDMSNDFLKAYPLRFCGYGYGMAEALRGSVAPSMVRGLYMMASGFIFARTLYKPFQVSQRTQSPVKILIWTVDTLVYETIASGTVPLFTASMIKAFVNKTLPNKSISGSVRLWTPAMVSLMSLPIIIPITDSLLDAIMNITIRQVYS